MKASGKSPAQPSNALIQAKLKDSVGKLPLAFEPNQGQTDARAKYVARASGYTAFLTADETVLNVKGTVLRMKLANSQPASRIEPVDRQVGKSNYYGDKTIVGVPHYAKVRYQNVYPGVDVVYSGNQRDLEYDFVVKPGSDPSQIRVAYEGTSNLAINRQGDLELASATGRTIAHKPVVYQTINGQRKAVNGEFVLMAKNEVGFKLGSYDATQTLVIDPTLDVLAFIGGASDDEAYAVASNAGSIYLTGRTQSVTLPTGTAGSHVGGQNDAFLIRLDLTTSGLALTTTTATYLGLATSDDAGVAIALDSSNNAYVAGYSSAGLTSPTPVVAFSGVYAAFVAKFTAAGALSAITYIGAPATTAQGFAIAVDASGNIITGGLTNGGLTMTGNQKTYGGGTTDGFIAKLDTGLNVTASTYLGGAGYDQVNAVAVDSSGAVYATGITSSGNPATGGFPTKSAIAVGNVATGQQTAFAAALKSDLSGLNYSSIFGTGGETGNGIAVDNTGVAYVVGATKNANFTTAGNTGGCTLSGAGALSATPASGTPILVSASPACADPANQSQGYLLSLTTAGAVNYLALQTATMSAPTNACLNLPKFGGTINISTGVGCTGRFGSWNGVAADIQQQAYVAGQRGLGGPPATHLAYDLNRMSTTGTVLSANINSEGGPTPGDAIAYGVAEVDATRTVFVAGSTTAAATANFLVLPTQQGYWNASLATPAIDPKSLTNQGVPAGSKDVLYAQYQFKDLISVPGVITLPSTQITTPSPTATTSLFITNGGVPPVAVPNTAPVTVTLGGANPGAFVVSQVASTNTYQVQYSAAALAQPGIYAATATFAVAPFGGDATSTTVILKGTITGPLVVTPGNTLTATSPAGTGILQPYNTVPGNATITVNVTTPVGSVPYAVSQPSSSRSANWPNCGLIALGAPTGPAQPANLPVSQFTVTINSACASQLPVGVYSETIRAAATAVGTTNNADLPFQLTITSGQGVTQFLPPYIFGTSTTPQSAAFTLTAPGSSPFTYNLTYVPNAVNGLPAANVQLSSSGGTLPANGTVPVSAQVSPTGLAAGVYFGNIIISSLTLPNQMIPVVAYVGTGLGVIAPAGGTLNISVPAGNTANNLTQPPNPAITITGLANTAATPYSITLPTGSAITFTPALPTGAFTLTGGSPCSTFAEQSVNNPFGGQACNYNISIDSTLLTAGTTYAGTIKFGTTPSVTVNVNITATQFPQLSLKRDDGTPATGLTFISLAGSNVTSCSNTIPFPPGGVDVTSTGGIVPTVVATLSPTMSWLGLSGASGAPGNLGITNPTGTWFPNVQAPNFYGFNVCVNAAALPQRPATYTGSVTFSGAGIVSPVTLPVTLIVAGNGSLPAGQIGIFRAGTFWFDRNSNLAFDPGVDSSAQFGQAGDVGVAGDWDGSGVIRIGVFRGGTWFIDWNNNGRWDGPTVDKVWQFGQAGDVPVVGDWTGDKISKIGVFRAGTWFLDVNNNHAWDPGVDAVFQFGQAGDQPVVSNWTGSGNVDQIGVFRGGNGTWYMDTNGNGAWDPTTDGVFQFGQAGDNPVVGNWDQLGRKRIGVFRGGVWFLDTSGTNVWNPSSGHLIGNFGQAGDQPVVGTWTLPLVP